MATPLSALALAELHERDEALGIDPHTPSKTIPLGPPATPGPPLEIPRADWHEEELEQRRRARALQPVREVDPPPPEDVEDKPARKRPKSRTPNIDRVRAWLDRGAA